MPSDSGPNDQHNCSQNWVMVCKTKKGGVTGKYPMCQVFWQTSIFLMQSTPTQLKRDPCCLLEGGFIASLHQTRRSINSNYSTKIRQQPGHKDMPTQKGGSLQGLPVPNLQTVIDSIVKDIFIKNFVAYHSSSSLHVNKNRQVINWMSGRSKKECSEAWSCGNGGSGEVLPLSWWAMCNGKTGWLIWLGWVSQALVFFPVQSLGLYAALVMVPHGLWSGGVRAETFLTCQSQSIMCCPQVVDYGSFILALLSAPRVRGILAKWQRAWLWAVLLAI